MKAVRPAMYRIIDMKMPFSAWGCREHLLEIKIPPLRFIVAQQGQGRFPGHNVSQNNPPEWSENGQRIEGVNLVGF
jgi:hypothetical protein